MYDLPLGFDAELGSLTDACTETGSLFCDREWEGISPASFRAWMHPLDKFGPTDRMQERTFGLLGL